MKKFLLISSCFLFCLHALSQDSSYDEKAGLTDVANGDPGLFMIMMMFLALLVICCIAVCILFAAVALLFILFTTIGIVSASFIAGLYKRSVQTAFRWFFILSCSIAGIICAVAIAILCNAFFHLSDGYIFPVVAGVFAGLISGLLAGRLLFYFILKMLAYAKRKVSVQG